MLNFLKDSTEAWLQRVRSPILGSVAISFLVFNWKPVWYLVFADQTVMDKFAFFDRVTDAQTLIYKPVIAGLVLAFATPWLTLIGAWVATLPVRLLRQHNFDQAHRQSVYRLNRQSEMEVAAANLEEARERRTIDAAKRIEEASTIDSGGAVDEIKSQRSKEMSDKSIEDVCNDLTPVQASTILIFGRLSGPEFVGSVAAMPEAKSKLRTVFEHLTTVRAEVELKAAIADLERLGLFEQSGSKWKLSRRGFKVFDLLHLPE